MKRELVGAGDASRGCLNDEFLRDGEYTGGCAGYQSRGPRWRRCRTGMRAIGRATVRGIEPRRGLFHLLHHPARHVAHAVAIRAPAARHRALIVIAQREQRGQWRRSEQDNEAPTDAQTSYSAEFRSPVQGGVPRYNSFQYTAKTWR